MGNLEFEHKRVEGGWIVWCNVTNEQMLDGVFTKQEAIQRCVILNYVSPKENHNEHNESE